jgi:hypothetical protein
MLTYNDRLYLVAARIQGRGAVWEAEDPAAGNDSFRQITPLDGFEVFELETFNDQLYVGTATIGSEVLPEAELPKRVGYTVRRTDCTGTPPYTFTTVVTAGGYLPKRPSQGVVSMQVYDGRLYVGTDTPAEIIRINPDDTWDLVVGEARETPVGWKYPLSGMDAGFGWSMNVHIWRMQAHDGALYAGTADKSAQLHTFPGMVERFGDQFGFDLYQTTDGQQFTPITTDGFGDMWQVGARNFASTPYGLFLGTISFWYGCDMWQAGGGPLNAVYLPIICSAEQRADGLLQSSAGASANRRSGQIARLPQPPQRLEIETMHGAAVLSWDRPAGATRFRIFRSDFVSNRELQLPNLDPDVWIPGRFTQVGTTDRFYFVDASVESDRPYHYYVVADNAETVSGPSNIARMPSLIPVVTFSSLQSTLADWANLAGPEAESSENDLEMGLARAAAYASNGDLDAASRSLRYLRDALQLNRSPRLDPWRAEDFEILVTKLARRVRLARLGLISPSELE